LDLDKSFTRGFMLFIHLLEFERVKPDSTAASLANIHRNAAHAGFGQSLITRRTVHDCIQYQFDCARPTPDLTLRICHRFGQFLLNCVAWHKIWRMKDKLRLAK